MRRGVRIGREQWLAAGGWLRPQTLQGKVAFSLIAHLLILFFVFQGWWLGVRRLGPAGTRQGVRTTLAYAPGKTAPVQARNPAAVPRVRQVKSVVLHTAAPEVETASAAVSDTALGSDEVSIARVQGFPSERPDLAGVGQTGDLILDVDVDETGRVVQVHERKSLGTGVDAVMMAAVEQWRFNPAVRGGRPVGARREIHFQFDRRLNPAGCGWECFALAAD